MTKPLSIEDMLPARFCSVTKTLWLLDINGYEVAFIKNLSKGEKIVFFDLGEVVGNEFLIQAALRSDNLEAYSLTIKGLDPVGTIIQMTKFHRARLCQTSSSVRLAIQFESETLLY